MTTVRQYTNDDKLVLKQMVEELMDFVAATDPIKRTRRLPGYGEMATEKLLVKNAKLNGAIYIAENEDQVMGFAACFPSSPQTKENLLEVKPTQLGNLSDIYVKKEFRSQGVGSLLFDRVEQYLKEKGCDSLWVEVFASNSTAHEYYKKLGFIDREIAMLKEF